MAINLYCGLMGSGKTYEVVSEVILKALRDGRRVVTNIKGLQHEDIRAYLIEQGADSDKLGTILEFDHESLSQQGFFPGEKRPGKIVQGGDLVVVDEVWRWWGQGLKIDLEHLEFFRMHRHVVDDKGRSCDLVVISQSPMDLDRKLKVVVEMTVQTVKLKALGRPKNYRVEIYQRAVTRGQPNRIILRKYDPEIFKLYSSYSGQGGNEKTVDSRQNVLSGAFFRLVIPAFLVLLTIGSYFIWQFFHPKSESSQNALSNSSPSSNPSKIDEKAKPQASVNSALAKPKENDDWRSHGSVIRGSDVLVLVSRDNSPVRFIDNPVNAKFSRFGVEVFLPNGDFAVPWAKSSRPNSVPSVGRHD